MAWTLDQQSFQADPGCQTQGRITAVWNPGSPDAFRYYGSLVLDIPETIDALLQAAEAARQSEMTNLYAQKAALSALGG